MAEYYDPQTYPKEWNYLQTGTIIDQYVIERELAHGGFSSVYLARQIKDQFQVAIKEYLPESLLTEPGTMRWSRTAKKRRLYSSAAGYCSLRKPRFYRH